MKLILNLITIVCISVSIAAPAFAQDKGADIYKSKCVICHGADGMGTTPAGKALKAAAFKDSAIVKAPDSELIAAVKKGKNKMPPFAGKLTDAQIKTVVAYIRTLEK
ncbi:MAG: cytochrome c [Terracidiphilus sp.]